jgi:hypothetical protein
VDSCVAAQLLQRSDDQERARSDDESRFARFRSVPVPLEQPIADIRRMKASAVAWRMSPAPRRVKSVAGGRDVEADGCGHDE